tara:strand:+ start:1233 stop:1376 length:144 start_codon:yes stop_codon:yes gene_type:complete
MKTFHILSLETGFKKGTIEASTLDEAEKKCLDKNINIYDDYILVENL